MFVRKRERETERKRERERVGIFDANSLFSKYLSMKIRLQKNIKILLIFFF